MRLDEMIQRMASGETTKADAEAMANLILKLTQENAYLRELAGVDEKTVREALENS